MQRISLSQTLCLSRLVYGMWRLADDSDTSPTHIQAKIETCLQHGITSFDQADIYGEYRSEMLFGKALTAAPHLKEKMEIITKCGIIAPVGRYKDMPIKYYDTSRAHITYSVEQSLQLMGLEQIDLLLIHRPDPMMDPFETGAVLDDLVACGKVRAVGVSNFKRHDWCLLQSAMSTPLVTNQIEISILDNAAFTNGDIAYLQELKIHPMAWSPLAGGALFSSQNTAMMSALQKIADAQNCDPAAVALAWLLAHPAGIIPVLGTNSLLRLAHQATACDVMIDKQTWFHLYSTANGQDVP